MRMAALLPAGLFRRMAMMGNVSRKTPGGLLPAGNKAARKKKP